jgi:hypothetical protein
MQPEDLIPKTPPAYGPETGRVVLDIVRQFPGQHNQKYFTLPTDCGTQRCIAGWTTFVHCGRWIGNLAAAEMLGLSIPDADRLFYTMNEDKAIAALEYVAKGDPIPWAELDREFGVTYVPTARALREAYRSHERKKDKK